MNISLIILNYNGLNDTLACLESLEVVEADNNSLETIVVDNNSSDGSQEALSMIKNIIFIKNDKNFGFSGGNNTGIKYALNKGSDFVILLNNDTIVEKSFVKNLVRAANKADIISPKIYFAKGYEFHKKRYSEKDLGKVIWYAGGKIDWQNVIGKHVGVDAVDKGQFSKSAITDFATGACMLVKREVFEKIGFFDEKYFLYLEDMDLCVRAKKAGFKILFEPRAAIWHKNAASIGGSGSSLQDYYFTKSRLLFALKFAKLRTKFAVFRQVYSFKEKVKRKALLDFLSGNFREAKFN
ncbi:hypothetical protein A3A54_00910 [Candidatus Curtissbacteria bacterium RIFCSPLOWO2_01_FULL_39_62]|uniref:Glycosyltransferase 2-like domain-containing protein n=1 Tax=Candidatus Curtissbacteria bacterium RIFCSPLOWO2_12_FULL_38_9 TaxID=1797735 RepID=A0A1F5I7K6_9BACT|nr:MAG: hypothetical protein A3E11_01855 [Candidatus Curtissbacteria bacterium RIFCSPHIGHO2_12_FULL_38_37]OGE01846.1 MAG: hypothetical protein A3A54_00910 [Candidatus Curtissbacteria bacterium RIFCSPLOWO2_01_FULL_39_62]OGE12305.1 MAG: hypothetical protein A3G14_03570 [Candidatus Curtissbacteria bacterium RIFCSPLOWO2_12_FULL_38_9]